MTQPVTFTSTTPNLSLPLLFSGQVQKEFFVNQGRSIVDALLPRTIVAMLTSPPNQPAEGDCFLVGTGGAGEWAGHDNALTMYIAGSWYFVTPQDGMQVFDQDIGKFRQFDGVWQTASKPTLPSGGGVVDVEVRAAFAQLIEELRNIGVFE